MLLLGLLFPLAQLSAQNGDIDALINTEKAAWIKAQKVQDRSIQSAADNRSDIRYCRLHWTVDPAVKYIQGEVMTVFEPTESVSSLDFDFSEVLTMDSIVYHGANLAFSRASNILTVTFPSVLPPFLVDSLCFYYQGEPTSTGFGSFEVNSHNNTPILWTLSEPYGAMEWWPCKQSLSDKIDSIDIFITHPEGYHAASNGLLKSETTSNGVTTAHWKHRYPIPAYLICMAVTDYVVFQQEVPFDGDTTLVMNYVYPEGFDESVAGAAYIIPQMQLFNRLFGVYPFQEEKYGHAQFGWGGGMEHQTMTFVNNFNYELIAHELAHHWFGDKVTCASWADIWLNEGFATYLSGLVYENLAPQYWQNFKSGRINSVTSEPGGTLWVEDTTSVGRIFDGRLSYAKGAMVLHMLRWVCGDTAFFSGVRNYLHDPALAYGYARSDDLQQHLEATSGKDLDGFMADWFYGQGYPSYQLSWSKTPSNVITVRIEQLQSHPSVAFFDLPVQIRLSNGAQDTTVVLEHSSNGQEFTLQLDFAPEELVFDPNLWIISKDNVVQQVTSTNEPNASYLLEIIPNPAHELIQAQLNAPVGGAATISLYQADGKLVDSFNRTISQGLNFLSIPVTGRAAGWYWLRLTGKDWVVEKLVMLR